MQVVVLLDQHLLLGLSDPKDTVAPHRVLLAKRFGVAVPVLFYRKLPGADSGEPLPVAALLKAISVRRAFCI